MPNNSSNTRRCVSTLSRTVTKVGYSGVLDGDEGVGGGIALVGSLGELARDGGCHLHRRN